MTTTKPQDSNEPLKSCPFCNSKDVQYKDPRGGMADRDGYFYCADCGARGPRIYGGEKKDSLLAWNTRAKEQS